MPQSACDGYRFGRFEVWTRNGLLLRAEKRIKIEELPFQLLLVLLESPGEVVVFGVQPGSTEWGAELTEPVGSALAPLIDSVIAQLECWKDS